MFFSKRSKTVFKLLIILIIPCLFINSIVPLAYGLSPTSDSPEIIQPGPVSEESFYPEKGEIEEDTSSYQRIFTKYVSTQDEAEEAGVITSIPSTDDFIDQEEIITEEEYPEPTFTDPVYSDYLEYVPKPEDYLLEYITQDIETVSEEIYETTDNKKTVSKAVYSSYGIKNKGGLYTASFSPKPGKDFLMFTYKDSSLELSPLNHASVTGEVYGNSIVYEDIYPFTDIRYTLEDRSLKEDILVQKYTGQNEFYFDLSVSNAVYSPRSNGLILFTDLESSEILFYMTKPFAVDNNGDRCDLVSFDLSEEGILKLTIDPEWLKDAAYPIIIDPTIYLPNATFTRSTVAYKQNGTQVAANQPRYETGVYGQAIMVEEGTAPLIQNNFYSAYSGTPDDGIGDTFTNWSIHAAGTGRTEAVTDASFGGSAMKAVQTAATAVAQYRGLYKDRTLADMGLVPGDTISLQARYKMSAQVSSGVRIAAIFRRSDNSEIAYAWVTSINGETAQIDNYITKKNENITIPAETSQIRFFAAIRSSGSYSGQNNQLWVDYFTCEKKKYCTSPTDVTRTDENITIPTSGILNADQGSIEVKAYIDPSGVHSSNNPNWSMVFTTVDVQADPYLEKNQISIRRHPNSTNWTARFSNANGSASIVNLGSITTAGWYSFEVTWKTGVGGNCYLNGVNKGSIAAGNLPAAFTAPLAYIGSWRSGFKHNQLIDDLRISDRQRSDSEILEAYQSNQPLPVDSSTTCKINFDQALQVGAYNLTTGGIEAFWNYNTASLGGGWGTSINTYNLNLIVGKKLFSIPGRGLPIGESVTYNSTDIRNAPLGIGWRLGSDSSLTELQDGSVILNEGDGSSHTIAKVGSSYRAPDGIYLTLQKISTGKYKITDKYQNVYNYQNNLPSQFVDRNDNTTTYTYDSNGRLYQLVDPSGRTITYTYNSEGKVDSITDAANHTYQLNYDDDYLTSIIDPDNKTFSFDYDANGHLSTFTDSLDRVSTFNTDNDGKLQAFWDARSSGQDIYETAYSQITQDGSLVTAVVDPGSHTFYYYHNPTTGNIAKFEDPLGHETTYVWNRNNLKAKTQGLSNVSFDYDSNGNVLKSTTPADSDSENNIVQTMQYNEFSEMTRYYDGYVTEYNYSNKGDLISLSNSLKESEGAKYDLYGNTIETNPGLSDKVNLLKNGSMEIAGTGGNLLADWTKTGWATATLEGFNKHGRSALKIDSSSYTDTMFYQHLTNITNNTFITLRADVKLSGVVKTGSTGGAVIKIKYGSNSWKSLYCWGDGEYPLVLTYRHIVSSNDIDIYIGLENAKGTVWLDGVQVEKISGLPEDYSLSSFNSVENCDFLDRLDYWNYSGVQPRVVSGSSYERAAEITHSSTMTSTIYQDVPLYGGESLTLSGMVKTSGVSGTGAYYQVEFYDDSDNQVGSTINTGALIGYKDFTRLTCTADAPLQASYARVKGVFEGSGNAYFDIIKLVPRNSEKYSYNSAGNYVTLIEDPLGNQAGFTYNENTGTKSTSRDALNNYTYYYYDDLNRLNEVKDPLNNSSYYGYDDVSNLISIRDPRSADQSDNTYLTQYGYNSINIMDSIIDPLDRNTLNTYDRCGNLVTSTLPNGMQNHFEYDAAHRLTRWTLDDGKYFDYTYDNRNNLTGVTDQDNHSYTWGYDRANRVIYTIDDYGYRLDYEWRQDNNIHEITAPSDKKVQYNYRGDGKLRELELPNEAEIYYRYDESGRVFQIENPYYAAQVNKNYYNNGWLKCINHNGSQIIYSYYDDGNIEEIISGAGKENYYYDDNGRLIRWDVNDVTQETYSYDAAGNLLTKGSQTFTYNSANQITNAGFTYDDNGNMTSDGIDNYIYNSANQLIEVRKVSDNSLVASFTYYENGLRKSKTSGWHSTKQYHWDALGNLAGHYYDENGNLAAIGNNIVQTNLRGDVLKITSEESGTASYKYDPWGNVTYVYETGSFDNQPIRYAGYYYDYETGLYYCKGRYYSPKLGRFLTKDPIGYINYTDPQSLNLYTYCGNNPVNCTDPSGNFKVYDPENDSYIEVDMQGSTDDELRRLNILSEEDIIAIQTFKDLENSSLSDDALCQYYHNQQTKIRFDAVTRYIKETEDINKSMVAASTIETVFGAVDIGIGAACFVPTGGASSWSIGLGAGSIGNGLYHLYEEIYPHIYDEGW